jgi:hypothetical protein
VIIIGRIKATRRNIGEPEEIIACDGAGVGARCNVFARFYVDHPDVGWHLG